MTEQTHPSSPASSPYDAPPAWIPMTPGAPGAYAAPAAPKRTFRDRMTAFRGRVVKLWLALIVAAACLIVGLGIGALVGHETAGSGKPGQPGTGSGPFPGQGGEGFGRHDFGGQGFGQGPDTRSDGQSGSGTSS